MTTVTTATTSSSTASAGSSVLGKVADQKDMFMKLLVAQLKNQDPSSPMDQKDMMAQMAQFTSVEQIANMVTALETLNFNSSISQGVGLIGRPVEYVSDDGSTIGTSSVTGVSTSDGQVRLQLADGSSISPSSIVRVSS